MNLGDRLYAIEAKSAVTATPDFFNGFTPFAEREGNTALPAQIENDVVYGGEASQQRRGSLRGGMWEDSACRESERIYSRTNTGMFQKTLTRN